MKLDLDNPAEEVRIEVIPLIDVIFCILTFFILAAVGLARQQAISLDLPKASTGAPIPSETAATGQNRLYVSVDSTGQVYIDQSPVPRSILYDVVQQHQQIAPDGLIVLYAARDARYEDVVSILDLLRSVGGNRVALATLPGNNPAQEDIPGLAPLPGTPSPDGASPGGASPDSTFPGSPSPGGALPDSDGLNELLNSPNLPTGPSDLNLLPGAPSSPGAPGSSTAAPQQPTSSPAPANSPGASTQSPNQ